MYQLALVFLPPSSKAVSAYFLVFPSTNCESEVSEEVFLSFSFQSKRETLISWMQRQERGEMDTCLSVREEGRIWKGEERNGRKRGHQGKPEFSTRSKSLLCPHVSACGSLQPGLRVFLNPTSLLTISGFPLNPEELWGTRPPYFHEDINHRSTLSDRNQALQI